MIHRTLHFTGFGLLLVLLLSACHSTPKHARYIPADASVVIGLNTGAISKKVLWSSITGSKILEDLKRKAPTDKAKSALDDIGEAGIDWMNTVYFYARPDSRFDNKAKMSLILPLEDAGKWAAFLKKTYPNVTPVKVKDRNEAMLDDKVYAAWTDDLLILINTVVTTRTVTDTTMAPAMPDSLNTPAADMAMDYTPVEIHQVDAAATAAEMEVSFSMPKDAAITGNDRFKSLDKDGHDISVFVAYDAIMDNAALRNQMGGGMGMMFSNTLWKNAGMAAGIDFKDGKIEADMQYYPSDSMRSVAREMGKESIDNDILHRLPAQNLNMAMGYHMAPDALKGMLEKMGLSGMANLALMQKGLSIDELLGAFTGDMALSVNDFRMEHSMAAVDSSMAPAADPGYTPKMSAIYAIKIRDKAKLDKLLNLLQAEMGLAPVAPNTYVFPMNRDSIVGLVSDKYIVVANSMASAQAFLQGNGTTPELVKKEISGHPAGMAIDFRSFAAPTSGQQHDAVLREAKALFTTASMHGGEFKRDGNHYHMELNFANTKENSLLQLINFAQKVQEAQKAGAVVRR